MSGRWLTMREAAERVGRSERTVKRWRQQGEFPTLMGRVRERDLLDAEARVSGRVGGRPPKETATTSTG